MKLLTRRLLRMAPCVIVVVNTLHGAGWGRCTVIRFVDVVV